jgi:hypothetical protein
MRSLFKVDHYRDVRMNTSTSIKEVLVIVLFFTSSLNASFNEEDDPEDPSDDPIIGTVEEIEPIIEDDTIQIYLEEIDLTGATVVSTEALSDSTFLIIPVNSNGVIITFYQVTTGADSSGVVEIQSGGKTYDEWYAARPKQ